MSERREELEYFFQNYKTFLEIEAVASFVKGRDYDVIKHFYDFFLEISQTPSNRDAIDKAKSKLQDRFSHYREENKNYKSIDFTRNHKNVVAIDYALNKNNKISQAFSLLAKAIKQYSEWRKCLNEESIKEIYYKNLCDKQRYYFGNILEGLNGYLANSKVSNNNILRQSLIEFHNGISHLNATYWHTGTNIDANQANTDRPANHFKRGALDSYKAIIKDFCLLAGQKPMNSIIENLKILRKREYQTIGDDKQRSQDNLYEKYQEFTTKIIESSKANKTQQ